MRFKKKGIPEREGNRKVKRKFCLLPTTWYVYSSHKPEYEKTTYWLEWIEITYEYKHMADLCGGSFYDWIAIDVKPLKVK